ncbi:MAG: hypothetical protein ACJ72E_05750 [Marmoricola sp.]
MIRKLIVAAVLAGIVLVGVAVYFRAGWDRMTTTCDEALGSRVASGGPVVTGVTYSWNIDHGFTCTYSDGSKRHSFLF